jgi:hypothetical protein
MGNPPAVFFHPNPLPPPPFVPLFLAGTRTHQTSAGIRERRSSKDTEWHRRLQQQQQQQQRQSVGGGGGGGQHAHTTSYEQMTPPITVPSSPETEKSVMGYVYSPTAMEPTPYIHLGKVGGDVGSQVAATTTKRGIVTVPPPGAPPPLPLPASPHPPHAGLGVSCRAMGGQGGTYSPPQTDGGGGGGGGGRKRSSTLGTGTATALSSSPHPTYVAALQTTSSATSLPVLTAASSGPSLPLLTATALWGSSSPYPLYHAVPKKKKPKAKEEGDDDDAVRRQPPSRPRPSSLTISTSDQSHDGSDAATIRSIFTRSRSGSALVLGEQLRKMSSPTTSSPGATTTPTKGTFYGRGGAGRTVKPSDVKAKERLEKLVSRSRVDGVEKKLRELKATESEVRLSMVHSLSASPLCPLCFFTDECLRRSCVVVRSPHGRS